MEPTTRRTVPVNTTDGTGVVSHAGTVLLAELAGRIGLTALLSEATGGLRERRAGHDPGRVLVDTAVAIAIADDAVTITDIQRSPPTPPAGNCPSWKPGTAPTPGSRTGSGPGRTPASGTCPPGTPT